MHLNLLELLKAFFSPTTIKYLGLALGVIILFSVFKKYLEKFLKG